MIRLDRKRDRNEPAIPLVFVGARRRTREKKLLLAKRAGTLKNHLKSSLWKPAKACLIKDTNGKCAYCEAPTDTVAHGDVEHFRPKSIWWWLALCYDNYTFSCQVCNQVYKGNEFPLNGARMAGPLIRSNTPDDRIEALAGTLAPDAIDDTTGFPRVAFHQACAAEQPLLPDPYIDDPEALFAYEASEDLHQVTIIARTAAARQCVEACETFLGLNREPLKRDRWLRYEALRQVWRVWNTVPAQNRASVKVLFEQAMEPDKPFAGMARFFVRNVWRIPGL